MPHLQMWDFMSYKYEARLSFMSLASPAVSGQGSATPCPSFFLFCLLNLLKLRKYKQPRRKSNACNLEHQLCTRIGDRDRGGGWVGLNTSIERGSEARFGGVHFPGPLCFGALGTFFGFFVAKFGSCGLKLL